MKKWIGLLVSLLMVLLVCMPAYAQENENMDVKTTITYSQSEALSMLKRMNDWRNAGSWYDTTQMAVNMKQGHYPHYLMMMS